MICHPVQQSHLFCKGSGTFEHPFSKVNPRRVLRSFSQENVSIVVVEFDLGVNPDQAAIDVRDRIAAVQSSFPRDVRAPTVARWNNDNDQPVVSLSILSPTRSARGSMNSWCARRTTRSKRW